MVMASGYGFSQADAKTEDHYFLGWPSYWNVFALYACGDAFDAVQATSEVLRKHNGLWFNDESFVVSRRAAS